MVRVSGRPMVMTALAVALLGTVAFAQRWTPADAAAKLTGTWQINFELSPQFAPRGGGSGAPARGGQQQYFNAGMGASAVRTSAPAFQRRGGGGGGFAGGGGGGPVVMGFRQAAATLTFTATADSVTINNGRGERTYAVDNKSTKVDIDGTSVTIKSRWDNRTLKQEFVIGEDRIQHDYEISADGARLNWKMVSSNMSTLAPPTEAKAVYDKKPAN